MGEHKGASHRTRDCLIAHYDINLIILIEPQAKL